MNSDNQSNSEYLFSKRNSTKWIYNDNNDSVDVSTCQSTTYGVPYLPSGDYTYSIAGETSPTSSYKSSGHTEDALEDTNTRISSQSETSEILARLLEEKEYEACQAAAYGLALLQSNEELHSQISSLRVQYETENREQTCAIQILQRRYENAAKEIDYWRTKYKQVQKEYDSLEQTFYDTYSTCKNSHIEIDRHHHLVGEIKKRNAELEGNCATLSTHRIIPELHVMKALVNEQKSQSQDTTIQHYQQIIERLRDENARLRQANAQLASSNSKLEISQMVNESYLDKVREADAILRKEIEETRRQVLETTEHLQTARMKCTRLEREMTLLNSMSLDHISLGTDMRDVLIHETDTAVVERYISYDITDLKATQNQMSALMLATHEKLYHFFHLTAQCLLHETNSHEYLFQASSRSSIDEWYKQVILQKISFLDWHAWLVHKISCVKSNHCARINPTKKPEFTILSRFQKRLATRKEPSVPHISTAASTKSITRAIHAHTQCAASSILRRALPMSKFGAHVR